MEDGNNLGGELRRLADGVTRLVREHVDLARMELKEDLRKLAGDLALGAIGLPFLLVALILLSAALALALSDWLGAPWAFALVGAVNLVAGVALGLAGASRARRHGRVQLSATSEEMQRSRNLLAGVRRERAELSNGNGSAARR